MMESPEASFSLIQHTHIPVPIRVHAYRHNCVYLYFDPNEYL